MSTYKGFTEARARANAKYLEKFAEVKLRMPAATKDAIKAAADRASESMNEYILKAVTDRMEEET